MVFHVNSSFASRRVEVIHFICGGWICICQADVSAVVVKLKALLINQPEVNLELCSNKLTCYNVFAIYLAVD